MSVVDELEKLNALRQSGAITEQEYEETKRSLIANHPPVGQGSHQVLGQTPSDENMWSMLIHLSQFCGYVVPFAGFVVPVVLWQIKKDESDVMDQHGRNVVNWMITELIMAAVFGLLCLVLIGIPLLVVLGILSVVFPIIGAVKANTGEVWKYPWSISFF